MSDPQKTVRGWKDQVLGLLTGNRRRRAAGQRERAHQRDLDERAEEARERLRRDDEDVDR